MLFALLLLLMMMMMLRNAGGRGVSNAIQKELGRGDKCGYRCASLTNVVCPTDICCVCLLLMLLVNAMQVAVVLSTQFRRSWASATTLLSPAGRHCTATATSAAAACGA
jgi:hypothetical protein